MLRMIRRTLAATVLAAGLSFAAMAPAHATQTCTWILLWKPVGFQQVCLANPI
jgi:hypothetical protein